MVCICTPLGLHPPNFFPEKDGQGLRAHAVPGSPQGFPQRLHGHLRPVARGDEPGVRPPGLGQLPDRRSGRGPARLSQRDLARPVRGRAHRRPDALPQPGLVGRGCRPVLDADRRAGAGGHLAVEGVRQAVPRRPPRRSPGPGAPPRRRPQHPRRRPRPGQHAALRPRRRRSRQARRVHHQRPRAGAAAGPGRSLGQDAQAQGRCRRRPRTFPTRPTSSAGRGCCSTSPTWPCRPIRPGSSRSCWPARPTCRRFRA